MADNINNVLNFLKELSIATSFNITVPSTQEELTFKQLNTEQLKQLLETIADTTAFNSKFNTTFYKILKENLLTSNINIDNLTIYDAQYIALQIRINSLSEKYTIHFTDDEIESYQLPATKHEINLKEVITNKNLNSIIDETILDNSVYVTCKVPTIKDENDFIKYFSDNINTLLNKELQNVVGEIFLYEIAKCIKNVSINDINTEFSTLTFKNRIEVVKQLPTTLTGKIISYIEKYKQALYNLYLIDIEAQIQSKTYILQKELQYNAALFNY
jgi:hypothetical protein